MPPPERRSAALIVAFIAFVLLAPLPLPAQRLASDFEIAQMEKQIASSRGFEAQLGARLNLGDARAARNEVGLAREEYERARALAEAERTAARADGRLADYAGATSWAAVASAKLGLSRESFSLLEEASRYLSDDPAAWNLYASAMRVSGQPGKAVAAAENALLIALRDGGKALDVAVYRHALATALIDEGRTAEAEQLLLEVARALDAPELAQLREQAARAESFEVYSSARGDVAAYVSLGNRTRLRLASICEERGDLDCARRWYGLVLEGRSDDAAALAALARLSRSGEERERLDAEAFEANPFTPSLVRSYRDRIRISDPPRIDGDTTGARMRRALVQLERGELRAARASLDALIARYPSNETLSQLRREAEGAAVVTLPSPTPTAAQLRALLEGFERLTAEQRAALDRTELSSLVHFSAAEVPTQSGTTIFSGGEIEGVPFRFPTPTAFNGTFDSSRPLRLAYRILGVTRSNDRDLFLLEPLRLENAP